jgi:adenosylhomocysteine nucleosidase
MSKLAIIAADLVEIAPWVKGWKHSQQVAQRHTVDIFESGDIVAGFAGMGPVPARIAADTIYKHSSGEISLMISVGYAGALKPTLKVADLLEPKEIICAADDTEIINSQGSGTLVSAGAVAGADAKKTMTQKYQADAVDMEAYSVADVARIYGIPFRAIKVISDEFDFPMPPMGRFIDDIGRFHQASFAIYSAMRPWIWGDVSRLAANSSKATKALCERLQHEIDSRGANVVSSRATHPTEVSR